MSNKLKESLIKKTDIMPSVNFDSSFFDKIEAAKKRPGVFSNWITWTITGCATASVLFIAVTSYNLSARRTFNHQEYVESVLEIQSTVNEEISQDEMIDLTSFSSDEI